MVHVLWERLVLVLGEFCNCCIWSHCKIADFPQDSLMLHSKKQKNFNRFTIQYRGFFCIKDSGHSHNVHMDVCSPHVTSPIEATSY